MAGLNKVTVDDINVKGKKVLVRVDFNVPLKDGVITNDNRITAALPTIKKLVADGGKVVLCSHLGKPKNGPEAKFSLAPAAARLAELLPETKVTFAADDTVVGDNAKKAVAEMADGDIVVLENTRFRGAEETKNGEAFAKELADLVDDEVFVMDAFGSAHRAHASTAGVTKFVKETAVGYLMMAMDWFRYWRACSKLALANDCVPSWKRIFCLASMICALGLAIRSIDFKAAS